MWDFHGRMDDYLACIEGHGEALAASLGMPDHTCLAVSTGRGGLYGALHCFVDSMVLVVGGHLLDYLIAISLEDYEVLYEIEEPTLFKDAFDQNFNLGFSLRRISCLHRWSSMA